MGLTMARQKLLAGGVPEICALEGSKAARFNARTMLIPSPMQVRAAIAAIPRGTTLSLKQLGTELAHEAGADVTCPYAAGVCWRVVAEAAEEDRTEGLSEITPWWRVTRDGKPSPRMPGGAEQHRALLLEENVRV